MSRNTLELRSLSTPDTIGEDGSWVAPDEHDVCFLLEVEIGERGAVGADLFSAMVVTPKGAARLGSDAPSTDPAADVLATRATIVLRRYTYPTLLAALASILERCGASTWAESCERLQRHLVWEYEDYRG